MWPGLDGGALSIHQWVQGRGVGAAQFLRDPRCLARSPSWQPAGPALRQLLGEEHHLFLGPRAGDPPAHHVHPQHHRVSALPGCGHQEGYNAHAPIARQAESWGFCTLCSRNETRVTPRHPCVWHWRLLTGALGRAGKWGPAGGSSPTPGRACPAGRPAPAPSP